MISEYHIQAKDKISFDEFIKIVEMNYDLDNLSQRKNCVVALSKLYNNRDFLFTFFAEFLKGNSLRPYLKSNVAPHVFILHRSTKFYIRAVCWYGINKKHLVRLKNDYAYGHAHDHNFNFLTLNYIGPGYETEVWEYAENTDSVKVGDVVDLTGYSKRHLKEGSYDDFWCMT